ncbi:hypothetical protein BC831DRAFT_446590 [Entophlyctis helioformis]|nr:hypothetical protein BC831DRAFT_446590 [Entophlyctis helioformis]
MSAVQDLGEFVVKPLKAVEQLLATTDKSQGSAHARVHAHVKQLAETTPLLAQVPLLTHTNMASLPDRSLVRFRGFVQDNSSSFEVFPVECTVRHSVTGEQRLMNLLYMDVTESPWEMTPEDLHTVTKFAEKQPHFAIGVPAEAGWVHDTIATAEAAGLAGSMDQLSLADTQPPAASVTAPSSATATAYQRLLSMKMAGAANDADVPLAVVLKTYGDSQLELNQIVEVVGVLERPTAVDESAADADPLDDSETSPFDAVPRIHVILSEPLSGRQVNPLTRSPSVSLSSLGLDAEAARHAAIAHLQGLVLGDRLAAEYLYLQLFSRITNITSAFPAGYFPINLCRVPSQAASPSFVPSLFKALHSLVPHARYLPLAMDDLNTKLWMEPDQARHARDTTAPDLGLCTGALQLPLGTVVVVDETRLSAGTLGQRGVTNLQQLSQAIQNAQVAYHLAYGGALEKPVDFRFLVVSEGKSMFQPSSGSESVDAVALTAAQLDAIRVCVELGKAGNPVLSAEMEERIAQDFAESRAAARSALQPLDDGSLLLQRLSLAQLIRRSLGRDALDVDCWQMAGELERKRLDRCSRLPTLARPAPTTAPAAPSPAPASSDVPRR